MKVMTHVRFGTAFTTDMRRRKYQYAAMKSGGDPQPTGGAPSSFSISWWNTTYVGLPTWSNSSDQESIAASYLPAAMSAHARQSLPLLSRNAWNERYKRGG